MTYTQIRELQYENPTNFLFDHHSEKKAWSVLVVLADRKGFNHWWHDIEDEDQDEIFDELKKALT